MAGAKVVTAAVLVIGNEVLSGRTQDLNLQFLANRLDELGVRLREARVIADEEAAIVAAVNECRRRFDYVFTTGGIGPTHDDITAASVAKAFGVAYGRNPEAEAILKRHYRPEDLTEGRLRMADMPAGVKLIENPVSRAPGFQIENVFVLPGVPRIMQAMFEGLRNRLVGGAPLLSRTVTSNVLEGVIAKPLAELQGRYPEVEIGSYPFFRHGKLGSSLVLRATDAQRLEAAAAELLALVRSLGGEPEAEPPA
jgi:molybdenum cofactor synthesis domain-containing protein